VDDVTDSVFNAVKIADQSMGGAFNDQVALGEAMLRIAGAPLRVPENARKRYAQRAIERLEAKMEQGYLSEEEMAVLEHAYEIVQR
jgi:hypothetical protein